MMFYAAWHQNCQIMTAVGAFLHINTVVILLDDVIRGNPLVVQAEMEGCKV